MSQGLYLGMLAVALSAAAAAQAQAPAAGKKPAAAKPVARAECKLTTIATGAVAAVVDGRTLVLDDRREVRLAAIEVAAPNEPAGIAAKTALEALMAGQRIELRAAIDKSMPETDRYRRLFGHVYVTAIILSGGPRPS